MISFCITLIVSLLLAECVMSNTKVKIVVDRNDKSILLQQCKNSVEVIAFEKEGPYEETGKCSDADVSYICLTVWRKTLSLCASKFKCVVFDITTNDKGKHACIQLIFS